MRRKQRFELSQQSVLSLLILCIYNSLTSIAHWIHQIVQLPSLNRVSSSYNDLFKPYIAHFLRIVLLDVILHDISNRLNWIEIRRVEWSMYEMYVSRCKDCCCSTRNMARSVVLHENKLWMSVKSLGVFTVEFFGPIWSIWPIRYGTARSSASTE